MAVGGHQRLWGSPDDGQCLLSLPLSPHSPSHSWSMAATPCGRRPCPLLLSASLSPLSSPLSLFSCIWLSEERIASHALPMTLICKWVLPNCFSLEALGTRVLKFYSLPRGSQTPDLGVLPRRRSLIRISTRPSSWIRMLGWHVWPTRQQRRGSIPRSC